MSFIILTYFFYLVPYRQQPYTSQPSTYNTGASSTIGSTKVGLPAGGGRMNPGPGAGSQLGFTTNRAMGGPFSNNQPDYSVRYLFILHSRVPRKSNFHNSL